MADRAPGDVTKGVGIATTTGKRWVLPPSQQVDGPTKHSLVGDYKQRAKYVGQVC